MTNGEQAWGGAAMVLDGDMPARLTGEFAVLRPSGEASDGNYASST